MGFRVQLTGFTEIDELLRRMPQELSDKVVTAAHKEAAKVLQEAEQLLAPLDEGDLVESIEIMTERRGSLKGVVYVGPNVKKGGWKGHFIEFGTAAHSIQPKNKKVLAKKPGQGGAGEVFGTDVEIPAIAPHPFVRPAFEQNKFKMKDIIRLALGKKLKSLMKRTIKAKRRNQ